MLQRGCLVLDPFLKKSETQSLLSSLELRRDIDAI